MRRHLSKEPITAIYDAAPAQQCDRKPVGLWYDVDGDWARWCEAEDFWTGTFHAYGLTLVPGRVLQLATDAEILAFGQKYRGEPRYSYDCNIDWAAVAADYDGIEIAPYSWHLRLDRRVNWYYGWDCASGCVWRTSGIASFAPLGTVTLRAREQEVA